MSTTLNVFERGSSFIQNETSSVRYFQGRKYITTRHIIAHANGGSYLYRHTMIRNGLRYTTIPGSGTTRDITLTSSSYEGHLQHVQSIRIYNGLRFQEFVAAPF